MRLMGGAQDAAIRQGRCRGVFVAGYGHGVCPTLLGDPQCVQNLPALSGMGETDQHVIRSEPGTQDIHHMRIVCYLTGYPKTHELMVHVVGHAEGSPNAHGNDMSALFDSVRRSFQAFGTDDMPAVIETACSGGQYLVPDTPRIVQLRQKARQALWAYSSSLFA